ncbi:carbohydrate-binding protein [Clostridium paraputrificum]|uniref:carbohydrate-binding protein n=1 Tax=Clostridium paraputrificum TaxID=29363 RepID=UPI003D34B22C
MGKKIKKFLSMFILGMMVISVIPNVNTKAADTIAGNGRLLVGYWHNFNNGSVVVKLKDVDPAWDVINVSFGESYSDRSVVEFHPMYDEKEFIADVAYLQSKGKKVVLSLGGAEGTIQIPTEEGRQKFMKSVTGLIDKFGFNGIDIDLEGGSGMILAAGDTDLNNPTTPQIVNFIKVIKELDKKYGSDFIVSMAPELSYVQGGNTGYAGNWGAYLPLINAVRDELDYLQVQHYNCGGNMALDGLTYNQGTADFQVAMVEMLLQGFQTRALKNSFFAPLKQEQVVIGVPASQKGTLNPNSGYIPPAEMTKALNYLIKGQSYGGQYKMIGAKYPNLRGIMTWSINWDIVNNKEFVKAYRPYFDALPAIKPETLTLKAASVRSLGVSDKNYSLNIDVPSYNTATSYELFENGKSIAKDSLVAGMTTSQIIKKDFTNKPYGTYTYSVVVKDATGQTANSTNCVVEVIEETGNKNKEDINNDGKVDSLDVALLAEKYNITSSEASYGAKYDLNSDGIIDIFDIVRVSAKIGSGDVDPPIPSDNEWKSGVSYKLGDKVTYKGKTYECIFAHTSHEGWLPGTVPTLWKEI